MASHRRPARTELVPQPLAPRRRRVFLAVMLLVPVLFFLVCELTLRLVGYGPDLSLFVTETISGRAYHVMNQAVKNRYFSRVDFSPSTPSDYFLVPKPAGTYRIFCLGGSTTVGYPYWFNGSFSGFLRERLRAVFPDRGIEIINVGMTATNSFTVLDVAKDLVGYEPDMVIVYDGHNEFYGALGIASRESAVAARWLTNASLRLIHLRTFLLMREAYAWAAGHFSHSGDAQESGTMMERLARGQYIPFRSTMYNDGLEIFRENLQDLKTLCLDKGIPLLLATQVSNLRDQPPFVSGPLKGNREQEVEFNRELNHAIFLRLNGNADSAFSLLKVIEGFDTLRAETQYQIGRVLDTLGHKADAYTAYRKARDFDQLRFRASSDFNDVILRMAESNKVISVDMESVFRANSPDALIGKELLFEHLHPNSRGYFLMAKAYAAAMRQGILLGSKEEWDVRDTVSDERLWSERCVTELDERTAAQRTEMLTSGWPFTTRYPNVDAISLLDTLGQIAEQLSRGKWNWQRGHEAAADYYAGRGENEKMEREYRLIVEQMPLDINARLRLARFYFARGRFDEMQKELLASLTVGKTIIAYRALGDLSMREDNPAGAVPFYEHLADFPQSETEQVENGYALGLAYARAGMKEMATAQLQGVLRMRPDYRPAAELLARIGSAAR